MTVPGNTVALPGGRDLALLPRLLREGFGPGAWHGPDLNAAVADVTPATAHWRPGSGRHNIAEVVMHHAWYVRTVTGELTGSAGQQFPIAGADWFPIGSERDRAWNDAVATLESEHARLAGAVEELVEGSLHSPVDNTRCFDLVLGITCHAIYHAGQIQLLKALRSA